MKTPSPQINNAILKFGMERRIKRVSTLVLLLIIICLVSFVLLTTLGSTMAITGSSDGWVWYIVLACLQFLAVAVLAASSTATEIAGEKARQTLDLLICSQMSPKTIIRGKLLSNFLFSLLIVVAMLPLYAVIYLFGGFSPLAVLEFTLFMLNWVFCVSAVAIFFSSVIKKSAAATVLTMVFWSVYVGGNGIIALIWNLVTENWLSYYYGYSSPFTFPPILWFNPVTGFVMLFLGQIDGWDQTSSLGVEFFEFWLPILLGIIMPVLISLLAIKLAERAIDPMKSGKTKGGV